MTGIEVARAVVQTNSCHVFRPRMGAAGHYDAKPYFTGQKRGWVALDLFSASAIVNVYDALNEKNRTLFGGLDLPKMARVAFKLLK